MNRHLYSSRQSPLPFSIFLPSHIVPFPTHQDLLAQRFSLGCFHITTEAQEINPTREDVPMDGDIYIYITNWKIFLGREPIFMSHTYSMHWLLILSSLIMRISMSSPSKAQTFKGLKLLFAFPMGQPASRRSPRLIPLFPSFSHTILHYHYWEANLRQATAQESKRNMSSQNESKSHQWAQYSQKCWTLHGHGIFVDKW